MLRISKDKLNEAFGALSAAMKVYAPYDDAGIRLFRPFDSGKEIYLSGNTDVSAKDFFFPQVENICRFKVNGKTIEVIDNREENEDFVVFGVRACDFKSFEILDRVFLSEPADGYYKNRREHSAIITLACSDMKETCFCGTFGIDPADPAGDITAYDFNGYVYFDVHTEKGTAVADKMGLEKCSDEPVWECKTEIYKKKELLPLGKLTTEDFGAGKTTELFKNPTWDELSRTCLGCGSCTFVCPTCQCYDIRDFDTGHGIQRYRCWDSCMYKDFTQMSAGQPRPTQKERFRQRFMHKLVYFPENNDGMFSCVGCGRCLQKCPQNLNIVKVIKKIQEGK